MVGAEGFEPPKSKDGRFTVCSRWPLVECAPIPFKNELIVSPNCNIQFSKNPEPLAGIEPATY